MNIKQKRGLAGEILEAFKGANRKNMETYFDAGDKILTAATLEGITASKLCVTIARELNQGSNDGVVSEATLRWCVTMVKTFGKQDRKDLIEMSPVVTKVWDLCHSQYDNRRRNIIRDLKAGKRRWSSISSPRRENEREKQKRVRFTPPAERGDHGIIHDPREVRILLEDEISIQDGIARLIQKLTKPKVLKYIEDADRRLSRVGETGLNLKRIAI